MISVGQKFREQRIRQGREIKPIADELCITSRYLQAIEADDWQQLPSGFFGRSFIRQYAIALGLDPAEFESVIPSTAPEPEIVPIQALVHVRKDIEVPPLMAPQGKGFFDLKMWAAVGGLVVAVYVGSNLYSMFEESRNGKSPQIAAKPKSEQTTSPQLTEAKSAIAATAEGLLSLSVAATESTWLEISSNGQRLFSGLLEVGQSRQFEKTESARMLIGNAGGVVVRRSGRDIGPIGSRGEVKVILFKHDAWEIVQPAPAQPKPAATDAAATADED